MKQISATRRILLLPIVWRMVVVTFAGIFVPITSAQNKADATHHAVGSVVVHDLRNARFLDVLSHPLINIDSILALGEGLPDGLVQPFRSQKQNSAHGVRWYFLPRMERQFGMVRFQEVQDETEVRRMLQRRKQSLGDSAELTSSESQYRLTNGGSSVYSAPPNVEAGEAAAVAALNRPADDPGYKSSFEVIDRNGELFVETSWQATEVYRYHDGVLFDAAFDQFSDFVLPSRTSLLPNEGSSDAIVADFFVDRIPRQLRQKIYQTTEAILGTQMQQKSNEADENAQLRRSLLQVCLSLAQAGLLDVEHVKGKLRMPTPDDGPYRSSVLIDAVDDSSLAKHLSKLASNRSQFAPMLHDSAALTVHTCIQLPQETRDVFSAADAWLSKQSDRSTGLPSNTVTIFCDILKQAARQPSIEAVVKIGWTPETEGVIYGGMCVPPHSRLLAAISSCISTSRLWPGDTPNVSLSKINDYEAIAIALPEAVVRTLQKRFFLKIKYVYIAQEGSRLWFAAGAESAVRVISDCIDVCRDSEAGTQTPLLSLEFDAQRWRSYPASDSVGVGSLLTKLDRHPYRFPAPPGGVNFARRSVSVPDLEAILSFGGLQNCGLTVDSKGGDLSFDFHLGEAIANYCLVRLLDYRLRWQPDFVVE